MTEERKKEFLYLAWGKEACCGSKVGIEGKAICNISTLLCLNSCHVKEELIIVSIVLKFRDKTRELIKMIIKVRGF